MEFTCHTTHPFKMHPSMAFSMFTELCNPRHNFSAVSTPPKESRTAQQSPISPEPLPPALATVRVLPLSVNLPALDISYKWNHTVCGPCDWLLSLSMLFLHKIPPL